MRVRMTEVEGTVEELTAGGVLDRLLGRKEVTLTAVGADSTGGANDLPPEIRELLDAQMPLGKPRQIIADFIREVLGWGDVEARRGQSTKRADGMTRYVRIHRRGSNLGGFAYVYPRSLKVTLRLSSSTATGVQHARVRNVDSRNPYKLAVPLTSESAKADALALAKQAYEAAISPS